MSDGQRPNSGHPLRLEKLPKLPPAAPPPIGFEIVCARVQGRSVRVCNCRLPHDGGWLECPPEARRALAPPAAVAVAVRPALFDPAGTELTPEPRTRGEIAATVAAERQLLASRPNPAGGREMGFTGNICGNCQSSRMVRNGVCETCLDCFNSGECG